MTWPQNAKRRPTPKGRASNGLAGLILCWDGLGLLASEVWDAETGSDDRCSDLEPVDGA